MLRICEVGDRFTVGKLTPFAENSFGSAEHEIDPSDFGGLNWPGFKELGSAPCGVEVLFMASKAQTLRTASPIAIATPLRFVMLHCMTRRNAGGCEESTFTSGFQRCLWRATKRLDFHVFACDNYRESNFTSK